MKRGQGGWQVGEQVERPRAHVEAVGARIVSEKMVARRQVVRALEARQEVEPE